MEAFRTMNSKNLLSVIIPVYNCENFLPRCLNSLLNQQFKKIEIICIDDGSTDRSLEILKHYEKNDNRIKVFSQENNGAASARNMGIAKASSPYITFVDADDWVDPRIYTDNLKFFDDPQIDFVYFGMIPIQYDGSSRSLSKYYLALRFFGKEVLTAQKIMDLNTYSTNKIFKKSIIDSFKISFPQNTLFEDTAFVLAYCCASKFIYYNKKPYYYYLSHPTSTMNQSTKTKNPRSHHFITQIDSIVSFAKQWNLFDRNIRLPLLLLHKFFRHDYQLGTKTAKMTSLKKAQKLIIQNELDTKFPSDSLIKSIKKGSFFKEPFIDPIYLWQKLFFKKKTPANRIYYILGIKIRIKRKRFKKSSTYNEFAEKIITHLEEISLKNILANIRSNMQKKEFYLFFHTCSPTADDIDSLELFKYFQSQNIPSIYIVDTLKKEHFTNIPNCHFFDFQNFDSEKFLVQFYSYLQKGNFGVFSYRISKIEELLKKLDIPLIFIQHGVTFLKESIFISHLKPDYFDLLLISNDEEKKLFQQYGWKSNQLLEAGLPRFDLLPDTHVEKNNLIFVFFTWRKSFSGKPLKNFLESEYHKNITLLLESLSKKFKDSNIKIAFSSHHENLFLPSKIPTIATISPEDISQYIKKADLLITDYSSIAFDFLYQEKPVLFFDPSFKERLTSSDDLYDRNTFILKKHFLFNVCDSEKYLLETVDKYVQNDFNLEEEHKKIASHFFGSKGNNCKKILDYFQKNT